PVPQRARLAAFPCRGDGFRASPQGPLGHQSPYQHDPVGRVTQETLPDGRLVGFAYDADGNLTTVTPPTRPAHAFGFDGTSDLLSYTPPSVPSGGGAATHAYNPDHQPTPGTPPA